MWGDKEGQINSTQPVTTTENYAGGVEMDGERDDLPADKRNATVLMTKEEYNNKLEELLNTCTCRILGRSHRCTGSQDRACSEGILQEERVK